MSNTRQRDFNRFHKKILYDMYYDGYIGASHTAIENAIKGFRKSDRGQARDAINDLIRWNLVIPKGTGYGLQVSLNSDRIAEIHDIIDV